MFLENNRVRIQKEFEKLCGALSYVSQEICKRLDALDGRTALAMKYLYGNMPLSDIGNYSFDTYLDYARQGICLWEHSPFVKKMPEDIFLNYVLYHRVNEEEIAPCRTLFGKELEERIRGMDMEEAALEVNRWCAKEVTYQCTDDRTSSALSVYRCGFGRCGEESVFAVNALRSAGVPARQVYAVKWSHCDDNHAWVEVWCDGVWHYLGAGEPEAVLDRGWFTNAASRAMAISSRWFDRKSSGEAQIGRDGINTMLNQLGRYAVTKEIRIRVEGSDGSPAAGAQVSAQVLNYSEFAPVALLKTGEDGSVSFVTGLGSLYLSASFEGAYGEYLLDTREETEVFLVLGEELPEEEWMEFDVRVPEDTVKEIPRGTPEMEEANARFVEEAAGECRRKREAFCPRWKEYFGADAPEASEELMAVLTEKDRRDVLPEVLTEHYQESFPYREKFPKELFLPYVWNPRIADEVLTPWRRGISEYFDEAQKKAFQAEPTGIWTWITENIRSREERERSTVYTAPMAALKLGTAGERSKKVLFVAIARTLGIPACLNPEDDRVEYWNGSDFVRVEKETEKDAQILIRGDGDTVWTCFQNWSIARLEMDGFHSLNLRGVSLKDGGLKLSAQPGHYRVLTANRLPSGTIFAFRFDFMIGKGEKKTVTLRYREASLRDMLNSHMLPAFALTDREGQALPLEQVTGGNGRILFWLDVGKEPTEHILNEIMECREESLACRDQLVFILRGKKDLEDPTLKKCLGMLGDVEIAYDTFGMNREMAARKMYTDPGKLPFLVVTDGPLQGIFAAAGYSVGMADMLLRILKSR